MKDQEEKERSDGQERVPESIVEVEKFLKNLGANHMHYLTDYKLSEAAFKKPPSTDFMRNHEKMELQENAFQNGEEILLSLLEQVKENRCEDPEFSPSDIQEGVQKLFRYFNENTPVTSAPHDEEMRNVFYEKLKKGYSYIAGVIQQEYQLNRLEEDQVYSCIQMIGEGAHYCAGRWRQVLDELFIGFSDRMMGNGEEIEVSKDRMLNPIEESFYKARIALSNKLANDFVSRFYADVSHGSRLHYVAFFQRYLNQEFHFNLPITEDQDPYLEPERKKIEDTALDYLKTKNVNGMILDHTLALIAEKIKKDHQFYERTIDFAKEVYHKNHIKWVKDDQVEFLSEDFFKGFSKDIKIGPLIFLLQKKNFILERKGFEVDDHKASEYLKKLISNQKWEDLEKCLKESKEHFEKNPLTNLNIMLPEGRTPFITLMIAVDQVEITKKLIQMGANVDQEDLARQSWMGLNRFIPTVGRRPLHMAVLCGNQQMVKLLLEKGADPFEGNLVHQRRKYNPFELATKQMRYDLLKTFIDFEIKKDKNRRIRFSNGEVPLLNYLILKRHTGLAKRLIQHGANIEAEERTSFNVRTERDYEKTVVDGRNSLHVAIEKSDIDLIKLMLERGANPFKGALKTYIDGQEILYSPIDYGAVKGRPSVLSVLLDYDIKKCMKHKVPTKDGEKSLMRIMVEHGDVDLVKKMVDAGVDINQKDLVDGRSPLHVAVYTGREDMVKLMIHNGANPFIENASFGLRVFTPFGLALRNRDKQMVDAILEAVEEKEISVKSLKGLKIPLEQKITSVLCYLIERGHTKSAKEIILAGENINEQDLTDESSWGKSFTTTFKGRAPLHVAVKMRDEEMVKFLLEKGADTELSIRAGMFTWLTPLRLAEKHGYPELVQLLKNHKNRSLNNQKKSKEMYLA
jgi:ankyrin repeat protein